MERIREVSKSDLSQSVPIKRDSIYLQIINSFSFVMQLNLDVRYFLQLILNSTFVVCNSAFHFTSFQIQYIFRSSACHSSNLMAMT
jgi:hypothetical protein